MVAVDEFIEFQFVIQVEFIHDILFMADGRFIGDTHLLGDIAHAEAAVKAPGNLLLGKGEGFVIAVEA